MSDASPPLLPDHEFRRLFHQNRLAFIREHGVEAFDQGEVLYRCAACRAATVVRDAFYGREPTGPVEAFAGELSSRWFATRASLKSDACSRCGAPGPLPAVRALYAHSLPEVGFDFVFEVEPTGPTLVSTAALQAELGAGVDTSVDLGGDDPFDVPPPSAVTGAWRMDMRGQVSRLVRPTSELDFRDQTGTFFDLRAGWRALIAAWRRQKGESRGRTLVVEVQSGYLIGVRTGVPGDPRPEARQDDTLDELFGRFERRTYDVLEFLGRGGGRMDAAHTPFYGELLDEWVGDASVVAEVAKGTLELFVMADSSEFLACIEDFCAHRGVAVEWIDPEADLRVAFHLDRLRVEAAFSYPFLRTLHTGRTFHAGARTLYAPIVTAMEDADDILKVVEREVKDHEVDVLDGATMRIRTPEGETVGRWSLMTIAGRLGYESQEGVNALLNLLGYDREAAKFRALASELNANVCPLCGEPARVGKVLRPKALLGKERESLVGADVGEHFLYYTQECSVHSTPVAPGAGRTLPLLEAAWEKGLSSARLVLVDARTARLGETQVSLLVGFEAGSLVLEPGRLKGALDAMEADASSEGAGTPAERTVSAYGFFPDALVVSAAPLDAAGRRGARILALEAVQTRFPARIWPLDVARKVVLPAVSQGEVERPA